MTLTYPEAYQIIGGISKPSKMPGTSWSISAFECGTGQKLRQIPGSVCEKCYACKGAYLWPNTKNALQRRLDGVSHPQFEEAFILVLQTLYNGRRNTYKRDGVDVKENRHRWFDSGDLQSAAMLHTLNRIALATPYLDHWLPTKEPGYVNQFRKEGGIIAPNLIIRVSNPMVGQAFKSQPQGLNTSTVGVDSATIHCIAPQQDGKCLDCRQCWDKTIPNVNYHIH